MYILTVSYSEEDVYLMRSYPVRSHGMFPPAQSHLDVVDSCHIRQSLKT